MADKQSGLIGMVSHLSSVLSFVLRSLYASLQSKHFLGQRA